MSNQSTSDEHTDTNSLRSQRSKNSDSVVRVGSTTYIRYNDDKRGVMYCVKGREGDNSVTWRQYFDPNRGRQYYSNVSTRKTVWYLPDVDKKPDDTSSKKDEQTMSQPKHEEEKVADEDKSSIKTEDDNLTSQISSQQQQQQQQQVVDDTMSLESNKGNPTIDLDSKKDELTSEQNIQSSPIVYYGSEPNSPTSDSPKADVDYSQTKSFNESDSDDSLSDSDGGKKQKGSDEPKRSKLKKATFFGFRVKRSSFTASFSENNSNADASDDFNNFAFAASDLPSDNQHRLKMEVDSDSSDSEGSSRKSFVGSLTRSNSSSGANLTMTVDNMKFNKKELVQGRGEVEDQVEEELFRGIGLGEVHVLCAVRCFQFTNDDKTKKERILAIARDYSGAYSLFLANPALKKAAKKFRNIAAAIPMLHFYEMTNRLTEKENVRFTLTVDGTELDLMTHTALREKLKRGMEQSFKIIKQKRSKELQVYRMSSIDFATTYAVERSHLTREQLATNLFNTIKQIENPEEPNAELDQLFHELRIYLRDGNDREFFVDRLTEFTNSKHFKSNFVIICGQILDSILKSPAAINPFSFSRAERMRNNILKTINKWSRFNILDNSVIADLIQEVDEIHNVMRNFFRSRGNLPDIPFPIDFFPRSDSKEERAKSKLEKEKEKQEKKLRESLAMNMVGNGVYLVSIVFTNEGEVLGDAKENFPSYKLQYLNSSEVYEMTLESEDRNYEWMLRYGVQTFSSVLSQVHIDIQKKKRTVQGVTNTIILQRPVNILEQSNKSNNNDNQVVSEEAFTDSRRQLFHHSRFRTAIAKAAFELKDLLNIDSLGTLYDKPIRLRGSNTIFIVTATRVEDKSLVNLSSGLKWYNMFEFEHKLYQKYDGIEELFQMERLGDDYFGRRWVYSSILYDHSLRSRRKTGLYLGFLCVTMRKDDYYVLVNDTHRYMIPHTYAWRSHPTEEQWQWIQSLGSKAKMGLSMFDNEDGLENLDAYTPDYLLTGSGLSLFKKYFFRAYMLLQKTLGVTDLGILYDLELINVDEENEMKMVVFCKYPTDKESYTMYADSIAEEHKKSTNKDSAKDDAEPQTPGSARRKKRRPERSRRKSVKDRRVLHLQKYIWRKGSIFELVYFQVFRPKTYNLFMKSFRSDLQCENIWVNNSRGFATDEVLRLRNTEGEAAATLEYSLQTFVLKEQTWLPLRWVSRIVHWYVNWKATSIADLKHFLVLNEHSEESLAGTRDITKSIAENNELYSTCFLHQPIERVIKSEIDMYKRASTTTTRKSGSLRLSDPDWNNIEERVKLEYGRAERDQIDEKTATDEETVADWLDDEEVEDLEKLICVIYNVDVNIEDVRDIELLKLGPTMEELTDNMKQEIYEKSIIRTLDSAEVQVIRDVVYEMVDILEVTDELVHKVVLDERTREAINALNDERDRFQLSMMNLMTNISQAQDIATKEEQTLKRLRKTQKTGIKALLDEQFNEYDFSYSHVIEEMIERFDNNMTSAHELLNIVRSGKEALDLIETMYRFERSLEKQERVESTIDKEHNQVSRDNLVEMRTTRKERQFLAKAGTSIIRGHNKEAKNPSSEKKNTLLDVEKMKEYIDRQVKEEEVRIKINQKAMKACVENSRVGLRGFSLPTAVPNVLPSRPATPPQKPSVSDGRSPLFYMYKAYKKGKTVENAHSKELQQTYANLKRKSDRFIKIV